MTCPDPGTLRALLDHEAPPDVVTHTSGCPDCTQRLAELRADADLVGAVLAPRMSLAGRARAVPTTRELDAPAPAPTPAHGELADVVALHPRWAPRLLGAAAAMALVAVLVATPGGRSATASFLSAFRAQRIAPISIDAAAAERLEGLEQLGWLRVEPEFGHHGVASAEEAERFVEFPVVSPDPSTLPPSAGTPLLQVAEPAQLRFTFDAERARRAFAAAGEPGRTLPEGFDGATLVLDVPGVVVSVWPSVPLVVGQAGALTADVEGDVTLEQVRAFLLDLPMLPESTRTQLAAIDDWRHTLPLPVPAEGVATTATTVDGAEAVHISGLEELGGALLWQRDGQIRGVAGDLSEDALRAIAEGLR